MSRGRVYCGGCHTCSFRAEYPKVAKYVIGKLIREDCLALWQELEDGAGIPKDIKELIAKQS